ncbi:MAG: glycosyltransferase family 4 protein [Candidatus Omnitrophica bacterium]|nr:glycosyltransferase family 4 protein [Candidatus Omnitrophota bacterium]
MSKGLRIAVNCRSILLTRRTGIGRYTYHLLEALGQIDQANEYILHTPKALFDFKRRLPDFSGYKNLRRYPDYFKQGAGRYDVYHFPCLGDISSYTGKLVVTIHDFVYKTWPQTHTPQAVESMERCMQAVAEKADHIICISENTRRDLHRLYNVAYEKSSVVYNGVDHDMFRPLSSQERLAAAGGLKTLGIERPYVLYVGTIEPRKNLDGLLEGFALLKAGKAFDGLLVVAGMKGWMMESLRERIKGLGIEKDVVFTGFISDETLRLLYNMAEVFVFPSLYEGFGFPIVEAFCCGAPVVTSATSSCAEIAGDAAVTVDPQDTGKIARAMEQVLTDQTLKKSLQEAGLKRAQEFSFLTMARKTLDVYRKIV